MRRVQNLFKERFVFLLVSLALVYVFFQIAHRNHLTQLLLVVSFSMVLLTSLYAVSGKHRFVLIGMCLGLPAILIDWITYIIPSYPLVIIGLVSIIVFLLFVASSILYFVLQYERVTLNTIYASLCSYILFGMMFGMIYVLVELVFPGAFSLDIASHNIPPKVYLIRAELSELIYFSFVTLTTVGFGDIVPQIPLSQSLSALEAMSGQFYLIVLVARLVGVHISQKHRDLTIE